jgi:hypothetical protein
MPPNADTPQVRKLCHRTHPQPKGGGTVTPVRRATYHFAMMPVSGPKTRGGNSHEHGAHERATETRSGLPRNRPVFSRVGPYRSASAKGLPSCKRGISKGRTMTEIPSRSQPGLRSNASFCFTHATGKLQFLTNPLLPLMS